MSYSDFSRVKTFVFLLIPYFCYSQLSSPKVYFPNKISTFLNERDFTMSYDGKEVYFTRSNFNNKKRFIAHVKFDGEKWGNIQIVSFSGIFNDLEPFLSPDGQKLFFSSNRDIHQKSEKKDYDIWYVERLDNGNWGKPIRLSDVINTDKNEFFPAVTNSGNLYFTTERENGIGSEDIFVSEYINGSYQAAKPLADSINTKTYEFNAYVSPNEDLIIFSSYGREDDFGGGDLYYSLKDFETNTWSTAKNLGKVINSKELDYSPFYDVRTSTLYFTSNRMQNGFGNLTINNFEKKMSGTDNGYGNIYYIIYKLD